MRINILYSLTLSCEDIVVRQNIFNCINSAAAPMKWNWLPLVFVVSKNILMHQASDLSLPVVYYTASVDVVEMVTF